MIASSNKINSESRTGVLVCDDVSVVNVMFVMVVTVAMFVVLLVFRFVFVAVKFLSSDYPNPK